MDDQLIDEPDYSHAMTRIRNVYVEYEIDIRLLHRDNDISGDVS